MRLGDRLPAECTRFGTVARSTATEARFIDVEACAFRIFDAIRKPFAIGQNGPDLDRVAHPRFEFATRGTVIPHNVDFVPKLETRFSHWKTNFPSSQAEYPTTVGKC